MGCKVGFARGESVVLMECSEHGYYETDETMDNCCPFGNHTTDPEFEIVSTDPETPWREHYYVFPKASWKKMREETEHALNIIEKYWDELLELRNDDLTDDINDALDIVRDYLLTGTPIIEHEDWLEPGLR